MDLTKTGWSGMDWIHMDQDRDMWRARGHSNELYGSIKCRKILP
jgi:hypothetical protein